MSRFARRVDQNQPDITSGLRAMGCSVQPLHTVGGGCPDLLVGYHGVNILLEVKTETGKLNDTEKEWHVAWRGRAHVVRSWGEAWQVVLAACKLEA
jgi:hypothetical protein